METSESISRAKTLERRHLSRIMQTLQGSAAVSYIVDSQCRFLYCNPAWESFARSNDAPQLTAESVLGTDLFDAIPDVLSSAYADAFRKVRSTGEVWEHDYDCSSPAVYRAFRMRIHLLKPQSWFLVTNALISERSHPEPTEPIANLYIDKNGLVTMCANCRCSRRVENPNQWDFVPDYLQPSVIAISHGLCPVCRVDFYPPD